MAFKQRRREVTLVEIVRVIGGSSDGPSGLECRLMGNSLDFYLSEMGVKGIAALKEIMRQGLKTVETFREQEVFMEVKPGIQEAPFLIADELATPKEEANG